MTEQELLDAIKDVQPLIFTTQGNLPIALLDCKTSWDFVHKEDGVIREIWCIREWFRKDDSVSVKREASLYLNEQAEIGVQQAQVG